MLELLIIIALIFINGILSLSEMALVSSRKSKLQQMAMEGDEMARKVLDITKVPTNYLSAVQVGITLTGILAGVFSGATIADEVALWLGRYAVLRPYSPVISFFLVVITVSYLSLIFGELLPKRIALQNPEKTAVWIAAFMEMIMKLLSPIVKIMAISTEWAMSILHLQNIKNSPITEEEIKVLIREGTRAGIFEEAEEDIVRRVLRLGDRRVNALMTQRKDMDFFDIKDPMSEISRKIIESHHSRFPVCRGSVDHVLGIVHIKDIIRKCMADQPIHLKELMREPFYMPESMRALNALKLFKDSGIHDALITDEYGNVQGMLTLHDILQAMVGDIHSVSDSLEPLYVKRNADSYIIDGMISIESLKDLLHIKHMHKEKDGAYETLGGYIIDYLDRIPAIGDKFENDGYVFEVVDIDHNRVDKVIVTRLSS